MFASLLQEVGSAVSLSGSSESLLQVLGEVGSSGILLTGGNPPARPWSGRQGLGKAPIPVCPAYAGCCAHSGSGVSRCPRPEDAVWGQRVAVSEVSLGARPASLAPYHQALTLQTRKPRYQEPKGLVTHGRMSWGWDSHLACGPRVSS